MPQPALLLVFLAGVLSITSPCILPILPAVFAGSIGSRWRPILIVTGISITFTLMGGAFSGVGFATSGFRDILWNLSIVVMIFFGFVLASKPLNDWFAYTASKAIARLKFKPVRSESNLSALVLGLSLGIVWIPCVGPILGTVLSFVTIEGDLLFGSFMLFIYSMGVGIPILLLVYTGKLTVGGHASRTEVLRKVAGYVLIISGILILLGFDKMLLGVSVKYFPIFETYLT